MAETVHADALADTVTEFLSALVDGTDLLRTAAETYGTDPAAFDRAVDRLCRLESRCDELVADIRRSVTDEMPPSFARPYLFSGGLVEVVVAADRVVSTAETVAKELSAMRPDLDDAVLAGLRQMSWHAHDATRHLAAVFEGSVFDDPDETEFEKNSVADVEDTLSAVRRLERDCDATKYDLIRRAFDGGTTAEALAVRELVVTMDEVANAAEDAADDLASLRAKAV
ncbi:DUF47 family protein [Halostella sp. PRR32]|uniref:DUF47 family protein n=1 Tax=Halostella sp. PRR32 TaxID=3098147 RepID=UPI002B1D009F|nr:DUF47 family protein [Halostella sp. PRR32]